MAKIGIKVRARLNAVLACAVLAAGACDEASGKVEPLPPLTRPSVEARAGLPEVRGIWRFAGFEIRPQDTLLVREQAYQLVPPAEMRIVTQRLDSIAGQFVRDGVGFPFTGEVRRDSALAVITFSDGVAQFAAGHLQRDTFWIEVTTLASAAGWSPGARAAMVRRVGGPPFRRLLGGAPIAPPVDSVAIRDSIRMDSLRRAGVVVPPTQPGVQPGAVPGQPGVVPGQPGAVPAQPGARPPVQTVPQTQPQRPPVQQQRPPAQTPRPQPQQQRPPAQQPRPQPQTQPQRPPATEPARPPVTEPAPENPPQLSPPPTNAPPANAPRDTLRFGSPPE
ncbi:hypothetical protein [Longimicrobium sp.]|uniref:hypothetical protein n=1 Tax=Longimicrobium sp. TaxID=2029185 RepID=UPI003B3BA927